MKVKLNERDKRMILGFWGVQLVIFLVSFIESMGR